MKQELINKRNTLQIAIEHYLNAKNPEEEYAALYQLTEFAEIYRIALKREAIEND